MGFQMININGCNIGPDYPPYLIAEISANHGGDINVAKQSIRSAQKAGASAVKIQTYTPDTMTINSDLPDFKISEGLWKGYTLYELYKVAHTPFEWHQELFDEARSCGITLLSTPFDETAVDLLEGLQCPAYKVASFEITDIPLIKYIANTGKPIILSTGMASLQEIDHAVDVIQSTGQNDLIILHCISSYPALTEDSNLRNITKLKEKYARCVGLSDHTTNSVAAICSIALGANVIEKHFISDKSIGGPDSTFSLEPNEFRSLVEKTRQAWCALSNEKFKRSENEEKNKIFRRSIYFIKNLKKGQTITKNDIKRIRPGFGLAPTEFSKVIGKTVKKDVKFGQPVSLDDLN